ncbi:MAG: hypothetical protein ABJN75_15760, partial [Hoeflea sp.]|uniref:hypothetical protein n=1 Tax=Hoeflea sp. TaxID=1940281 RepID=UPI003298BBC5
IDKANIIKYVNKCKKHHIHWEDEMKIKLARLAVAATPSAGRDGSVDAQDYPYRGSSDVVVWAPVAARTAPTG